MMCWMDKIEYLREFIRQWGYTRTIEYLLASDNPDAPKWVALVEQWKVDNRMYWSDSKVVEHKWQGWRAL